jgi:hypothetical protein
MPTRDRRKTPKAPQRRDMASQRIQARRQAIALIEHHQQFNDLRSKRLHNACDGIEHMLAAAEARQPVVRQDNPEPCGCHAIARDGLA